MVTRTLATCAALFMAWTGQAAPASAMCRNVTVVATGSPAKSIDDAVASSTDALVAKILKTYGRNWGPGSHRNGSHHCDRALGYRPQWTCQAKTVAICAPDTNPQKD